jgi:hypothetical protein
MNWKSHPPSQWYEKREEGGRNKYYYYDYYDYEDRRRAHKNLGLLLYLFCIGTMYVCMNYE